MNINELEKKLNILGITTKVYYEDIKPVLLTGKHDDLKVVSLKLDNSSGITSFFTQNNLSKETYDNMRTICREYRKQI